MMCDIRHNASSPQSGSAPKGLHYSRSQAAEHMLNTAIAQAKISESFEEYLEIYKFRHAAGSLIISRLQRKDVIKHPKKRPVGLSSVFCSASTTLRYRIVLMTRSTWGYTFFISRQSLAQRRSAHRYQDPRVRVPSLTPILRIGAAFVCQNVTGQITSRFLLTTAGSEMRAKPLKTCNGLLSFS